MKKQNVMVIPISMLMLCVLFIGCNRKEQQVPLSELMDWNKEKISESGYPEWAPPLFRIIDMSFMRISIRKLYGLINKAKKR